MKSFSSFSSMDTQNYYHLFTIHIDSLVYLTDTEIIGRTSTHTDIQVNWKTGMHPFIGISIG